MVRSSPRNEFLITAFCKSQLWTSGLLKPAFANCRHPKQAAARELKRLENLDLLASLMVYAIPFENVRDPLFRSVKAGVAPDFDALEHELRSRRNAACNAVHVYWPTSRFAKFAWLLDRRRHTERVRQGQPRLALFSSLDVPFSTKSGRRDSALDSRTIAPAPLSSRQTSRPDS